MTWCLTERWTQTGHTTRCLDTEDHNKHFHSIKKLLTFSLEQNISCEANQFAASQKIRHFYGTRWFITTFTSARYLSLFWTSSIQSITPHRNSRIYILFLFSHLRLGLLSDIFPSDFSTNTLYTTLPSPIRATCPAYLILLDFITRKILGEEYKSLNPSFCSFLHSPVTSSLLGPIILLNTLLSNTLSHLSSLNVSDEVHKNIRSANNGLALCPITL